MSAVDQTAAIGCHHCGETVADAPLLCFCGVPVTCDLCDGDGCRFCGRWGWLATMDVVETAVDPVELFDGWDWDEARHARAEAEEGR